MNEAPHRGHGHGHVQRHRQRQRRRAEDSGSAPSGPDPLEVVRNAVVARDPEAFARAFTGEGSVRVPRREGDILLRGRSDLTRAGRDLQSLIRELSWTPSRRFVSSGEVTEEAVVLAHLHEPRPGRGGHGPPIPAPARADPTVRVPLRIVASTDHDGRISRLTLWLDWAALRDPKGNASAGGAASALVARARSRDDRGLRIFENTSGPFLTEPVPSTPPDPDQHDAGRPQPMSRPAIWWQLHRTTLVGTAMALAAVLVLGWIGLTVLRPLILPQFSSSTSGDGIIRGAGPDGSGDGPADPKGTGGKRGATGPGTSGSSDGGNDPRTRGTGAPVVSSQKSGVKPTVQEGDPVTFLSDVLFPFGSPGLSPAARNELGRYAAHLQKIGVHGTIQVNGYTDSIGTGEVNLALSRQRALAVARALAPHLDGRVVTLRVQAFGENDPIGPHSNETAAGRSKNRRVVVVIPQ